MKPRFYKLLEECVADGVARGLRLARKHTDTPTEAETANQVQQAVMLEISEWFEFEEFA